MKKQKWTPKKVFKARNDISKVGSTYQTSDGEIKKYSPFKRGYAKGRNDEVIYQAKKQKYSAKERRAYNYGPAAGLYESNQFQAEMDKMSSAERASLLKGYNYAKGVKDTKLLNQ